jgi:hypothetical protein
MNDTINTAFDPEALPVIDASDATLAPVAGEGEAASEEVTIFIAEDAEAV